MTSPYRFGLTAPTGGGDDLPRDGAVHVVALRSALLLVVAGGCTAAVLSGWVSPIRVVLALAFLLFVPGLALGELLGIRDLAQRLTIATPASLGLETLLAVVLVYTRHFSISLAIAILAALTGAALGGALLRALRAESVASDRRRLDA